ncbi:MAG: hypothetical protein CMG69_04910 [Candidatus Marinimicrobia bacterium]|nr:hypothetical protein [Candidatus Neomarinimicrobiota bacterium]|tara:strand:+ start:30276 stop:30767 length:492 start_codon:yes stop_codon:yes gene_type:complete
MIFDTPLKQGGLFLIISIVVGALFNSLRTDFNSIPMITVVVEQATGEMLLENQSDSNEIRSITTDQALLLYNEGILFVDARDIEEYEEGHIPGALSSEDFMELTFQIEEVQSKSAPIITYCGGGECAKSEDLAYDLQATGYNQIYIYLGGWMEWENKGFEIEK